MAVRLRINTLTPNTYRFADRSADYGGYLWLGRIQNAPQLEELASPPGTEFQVKRINVSLGNSDGIIPVTENLWGGVATLEIDNGTTTRTWSGIVKAYDHDGAGNLAIGVTEDPQHELSRMIPDEVVRLSTWSEAGADAVNTPVPTVLGGSAADPVRVPGILVDRTAFTFLLCVGEIRQVVKVFKDRVEVTEGFTAYVGAADQETFPGFAIVTFAADPRDDSGRWPEIHADVVGLKLGDHTEEECRNPARCLKYLLETAASGVGGWGLGVNALKIDGDSFDQAILDCQEIGFKLDGALSAQMTARQWISQMTLAMRGSLDFRGGKYTLTVDKARGVGSGAPEQVGSVLTAADAVEHDLFGASVALSEAGDVLVVGADGRDGVTENEGCVYTYDRSGTSWVQRGSALKAGDAAFGDTFGASVALSADGAVLAVGAPGRNGTKGGVYLFDLTDGAWVQRGSVLEAGDAVAELFFGASVAFADDASILAVGAYGRSDPATYQGGVYLFDLAGGAWVQRGDVLLAADAAEGDCFGIACSLSADGSILAVGAYARDAAFDYQGGVYLFDWSGSAWVQRGNVLLASDGAEEDFFGRAVSLSADGEILAVGAYARDDSATDQGGVYLFDWSGSAWAQRGDAAVAPDGAEAGYFGISCSLKGSGRGLVVGSDGMAGASAKEGGVYTFEMTATAAATFNLRNMALQRFGRGQSTQRINRVIAEYRHDPVAGKWLGWQQRDDTTSQSAIGVQERRFTLPLVRDHGTAGLVTDYHLGYEVYGEQQIMFNTAADCSRLAVDSLIIIDRPDLGLLEALFRVTALRPGDFVSTIEARSFSDAMFDPTTVTDPNDPEIDPRIPGTTMENALPVPTLEGSSKPAISEDTYILADGTILTDISVSFTLPADYKYVDHVNIYYRLNGTGSWLKAGETSTEAHVIKALRAVKGQTIQIDARIVNWFGVEGAAGLSDSLALVGKSDLPSDVTGFQATQDGGMIDLIWNHISDLDRRGYEIREGGVAWNEGVPVCVGVAENSWSVPIQEERRYVFRVKATDNSGGESATAAETTITPIILLPKNVIITYDELDLRDGTHTFTAWASSGYTMAHMAGKASDPGFIGEKWSDFPVEVLCIKELEPGVYYPAGDYVSAVRDLGKPVTVKIIPRIIVDATAGTAFQLKFRSSLDNVTWTNWFDAVAQTVTARYLQCRVYLTTSDSSKTPKVRAWLWVVDVPDVDRVGADATVCVGGTEISFGYVYYVPPAVMAMAAGGSRRAEITAKTTTGFTVIVVDPDGADVGGTVDWHARGY